MLPVLGMLGTLLHDTYPCFMHIAAIPLDTLRHEVCFVTDFMPLRGPATPEIPAFLRRQLFGMTLGYSG